MGKRIISEKERTWLSEELRYWRSEDLLTEVQLQDILGLYETPGEISARQRSRGIFVLMSVAALLVGLATLLLIGYNWEALPAAIKLAIIFIVILGTHALGFHLRFQRQARIGSEVAFFLGCIFFGAGIALVAQIFHLNAHYPDGIWWWALGVLPFALCLDSLLMHALLVAVLGTWAGLEVLGFPNLGAWFFGRWPGLGNGAYSLPLLAAPGLLWAYRKQSASAIGLYAPLLAWWVILQPFGWHWQTNPVFFIGSVGGLFLVVAESHRPGSALAIPYRFYGVLLSLGVLAALSFRNFQTDLGRDEDALSLVQTEAIVVLAAIVVSAAILVKRRRGDLTSAGDFLRRQWLPLGMVGLMAFSCWWTSMFHAVGRGGPVGRQDPSWVLLPTVLANVAMIAAAWWLVQLGLREDRGRPFAAGVIYFLLWAVMRYIDLFGDFGGMLGAAGMFFLCGAAIFGVALYWKRRKEIRHV